MTRVAIAFALIGLLAGCRHAPESGPRVLLLGEVHDSADGHAARARMLRKEVEAGWRPAIAMEQFDTDQQDALDAALRACTDADCVVAKLVTAKSGWTWAYYKPLIALALEYKLPIHAANLSRADAGKVIKSGFAASVPADVMARYGLDALPSDVLMAQEAEVRDNHCGMLPEAMVTPMAKAQIARDVVMAESMRRHADRGVVLIAGNGHVRTDIAVPYWLRRQGLSSWAVGFVEPGTEGPRYDARESIPATQRPDPCAGFKAPKASG